MNRNKPDSRNKAIKLVFRGGCMHSVYRDELQPLYKRLGETKLTRASMVEPTPEGKWVPDMTLSGGPASLGEFDKRADAINAEVKFLEARM